MSITPESFIEQCKAAGVVIERVQPCLITLSKPFEAGSAAGFTGAETDVSLIYEVPQSSAGSTWGTDGGSIGGAVALKTGVMRLNRTGCNKVWLKKLIKARAKAGY